MRNDLDAIRARANEAKDAADVTRCAGQADLVAYGLKAGRSVLDIPALLAEVERLRAVVDVARAWRKAVKAAVADDIPEPDAWTVFEGRALVAAVDALDALDALDAGAGAR